MNISNLKNIIVLKNINSNLIDEAYVILKENKKVKNLKYINKNQEDKRPGNTSKEYIFKEAEYIINNYISDTEKNKMMKFKKIEKQCKKLKIVSIILLIANILIFFIK